MAFNQPPNPAWKLLGKLELVARSRTEERINVWLMEILHPLNLPEDFFNRILKSVHTAHFEKMTDFESVSLLVYALSKPSKGQIWGFFRIDKIGNSTGNKSSSHHSIEFYLYLESS